MEGVPRGVGVCCLWFRRGAGSEDAEVGGRVWIVSDGVGVRVRWVWVSPSGPGRCCEVTATVTPPARTNQDPNQRGFQADRGGQPSRLLGGQRSRLEERGDGCVFPPSAVRPRDRTGRRRVDGRVREAPGVWNPAAPGVVALARHAQHPGERGDAMVCLLHIDQPVLRLGRSVSRAKKTAALFLGSPALHAAAACGGDILQRRGAVGGVWSALAPVAAAYPSRPGLRPLVSPGRSGEQAGNTSKMRYAGGATWFRHCLPAGEVCGTAKST